MDRSCSPSLDCLVIPGGQADGRIAQNRHFADAARIGPHTSEPTSLGVRPGDLEGGDLDVGVVDLLAQTGLEDLAVDLEGGDGAHPARAREPTAGSELRLPDPP